MRQQHNRQQGTSLKPEYALKRVNDLINSGGIHNDKEKRVALDQLHQVIGVKRKGAWTKTFEALMKRHIELCVDLKDHHTAKDGLHQYRNLCQTVDPNSLETVIVYLMELSEAQATAARSKADKVALAAAARIKDLDQEESPESIMLSSMTEEGAKDRTDREVVVPWLKFLWETYRAILELLYKIPKLERVYHKTCEKAFKFCHDYSRVLEFRRLCDMLRLQLNNLQKQQNNTNPLRAARPQFEWTPENIEFHLNTRFAQLEVATSLELWNEGYRTVEDIYAIIVDGGKSPKPELMMTYYEKLIRIFWVSENKLFHAYAWFRFYCLSCARKDLKKEEKTMLASCVLLAALTIPNFKSDVYSTTGVASEDPEEAVVDKNSQMALLLDFQENPSRRTLLAEIVNKGIIAEVLPELATLYESLEVKFQPLGLIKNVLASIEVVKGHKDMEIYATPLQKIVVLKVMQQLSRVYSTVRLDFVYKLFAGLKDLSVNQIERILIEGVSAKQLQLRVNHSNGSIQFLQTKESSEQVNIQVATFGSILNKVCNTIATVRDSKAEQEARQQARVEFLRKVQHSTDGVYTVTMDRKNQIERRKEEIERMQTNRQIEEKANKEQEEAVRRKEEARRLEKAEEERTAAKVEKQQDAMEVMRVQKELEKFGVTKSTEELTELDTSGRMALIQDARNDATKAKEEENRKFSEQARRLDYIARALRIEGAEAIKVKYEKQLEEDTGLHAKQSDDLEDLYKSQHVDSLVEKKRLMRMQAFRPSFEGDTVKSQKEVYDKKALTMRKKVIQDKRDQNIARARRLFNEECERQEEEEQKAREIAATKRKEEEAVKQHEQSRKQREFEEESEKKREIDIERMQKQIAAAEAANAAKQASAKPEPLPREAAAASSDKPAAYVPPGARGGGGAAPAAGGGGGGYVPPSARGGPGFGSSAPAPSGDRGAPRDDAGGDRWRGSGGGGDRAPERAPDRGGGFGSDRGSAAPPTRAGVNWGDDNGRGGDRGGGDRGGGGDFGRRDAPREAPRGDDRGPERGAAPPAAEESRWGRGPASSRDGDRNRDPPRTDRPAPAPRENSRW